MLSIEECKKYLKDTKLKDKEILIIRNYLYALANRVIDTEINKDSHDRSNNPKKAE